MMSETSSAKERKLGVAGLAGVATGWVMLLYVQTFSSVCGSSARPLSWAVLLTSLASPIAILWAAVGQVVVGDWTTPRCIALIELHGNLRGLLTQTPKC